MLVAWDLETELIPTRETIATKSKSVNVGPYVTPRPVIASFCDGQTGGPHVVDMDHFCRRFISWVEHGVTMAGHNIAAFDLDVLYTHGPPDVKAAVIEALDRGLIIDTMLLDWLVRLAKGDFDKPKYDPETKKWYAHKSSVRGLAKVALDYCGIELDKDPDVRCGYGRFLGAKPSPAAALPEKFRVYAEQDAWATYEVAQYLLRRADAAFRGLFGPLSCCLQARAAFVAHQADKQGVYVDQPRAAYLHSLFRADEEPLQERLVAMGLGEWAPVPKAPREVTELPVAAKDVLKWRKL